MTCVRLQVYLNLVLEFVPDTVYRISKHYSKAGQRMPSIYVKLYTYQVDPRHGIMLHETQYGALWNVLCRLSRMGGQKP